MKTTRLLAATTLCALLLAAPRARAGDDPFAAYRIPAHAWTAGSARFDLSFARRRQANPGYEARTRSFQTSPRVTLERGRDSDPLLAWIRVTGSGALGSNLRDLDDRFLASRHTTSERAIAADEGATVEGSLRIFPWSVPVGLGLEGQGLADAGQSRRRVDHASETGAYHEESRDLSVTHTSVRELDVFATLSVGRVRDATVVYDVHVLEERLRTAGALERPLSDAGRARLAAVLAVAPRLAHPHERPARFAWAEIERVLRADGALGEGGLDAFSVLWGLEPVWRRTSFRRLRGWSVAPTLGATTRHDGWRQERSLDTRRWQDGSLNLATHERDDERTTSVYDSYLAGLQAELHRPIGWAWQLDATARAQRPLRREERGFGSNSALALTWEIADRWSADARIAHTRSAASRQYHGAWLTLEDGWRVYYGAGVLFRIEDHLALRLDAEEQQQHTANAGRGQSGRDAFVSLGLTYRFLGALDAPGLLAPVRPLR